MYKLFSEFKQDNNTYVTVVSFETLSQAITYAKRRMEDNAEEAEGHRYIEDPEGYKITIEK